MRKIIIAATVAASFCAGVAVAKEVHDWRDLNKVHNHVKEAIMEMERVAKANHYDMDGHAAKAEEHLRASEHELDAAVESARRSGTQAEHLTH